MRGSGAQRPRMVLGCVFLVLLLLVAATKLVYVQVFQAEALSAKAARQRATPLDIPAQRGSIVDRAGRPLAFSVDSRVLYVVPQRLRANWQKARDKRPDKTPDFETFTAQIADTIVRAAGDGANREQVLAKLRGGGHREELAENIGPATAWEITSAFPDIGSEYRAARVYPNGSLAANVIGTTVWRKDQKPAGTRGVTGLESSRDQVLAGRTGRRIVDTEQGRDDVVIPGTERDLEPATPGASLELTLDIDVQFLAQQLVTEHARRLGAHDAAVLVLDAKTAEVLAMATEQKINTAVSVPFEPGGTAALITAAGAVEDGTLGRDQTLTVPERVRVDGVEVRDQHGHATQDFTLAGVLARSSDVGTVQTARKLGDDRFANLVSRFGLGVRTEIGLPGESAGQLPPREHWSASTLARLPIGHDVSVTLPQLAGMYQAIANDGLRVPPRLVRAETKQNGHRVELPGPTGVRVVSPQTAATVRGMLRAVVQDAPGQKGTSPVAALPGYQVAGKPGTRTQPSGQRAWNCFAGMFPAESPRFVIATMVDAAETDAAARLFREVADYLAQRYHVPMAKERAPVQDLVAPR
ncbi:penicillin-binding protein 2 [Allokutzneria sp. A3M-2-11 16]|uniref:peptidoglycan D,D-transpeptidase FtsI family protein n=1 Tax=Allokutzneria sp. A3M-2-11 16 TaxID=2962043 RepID=UPI0020B8F102|nr:penicillin-binding protein 2 [Allokutzneria sp. A3M-2-11 16]MCP3804739.1 penicillin-binding protein 2 [Allokutzneria sp. A3M-2-11 16]